jgi:RecA-family ATPase
LPISNNFSPVTPASSIAPFDLDAAIPIYHPTGMPAREFAGPTVGEARLFPRNALSLLVSLGGGGKTSLVVTVGAHIAAGKAWGFHKLQRGKVIIFSVEETQDERNRKFGAAVHSWTDAERERASENMRLISCLGLDVRLTKIEQRQVSSTEVPARVIEAATAFGASVIILDHLQGFVSGDLNNSDTATAMAEASNRIVAATGAAVVQTAHIAKMNISAQSVLDGFTTGSLAFENAARQVSGIIPVPADEAKEFGPDPTKYLMIGMPKNSYGPARQKAYLSKVYVAPFHTITVEPYTPPVSVSSPLRSASERLKDDIFEYVKNHPGTTPNALDGHSGKRGRFKASKQDVRDAARELQDEGALVLKTLTNEERTALRLPHQAKQVYEHVP